MGSPGPRGRTTRHPRRGGCQQKIVVVTNRAKAQVRGHRLHAECNAIEEFILTTMPAVGPVFTDEDATTVEDPVLVVITADLRFYCIDCNEARSEELACERQLIPIVQPAVVPDTRRDKSRRKSQVFRRF